MKVIRASRAGFCMGVSLALKKLEQAIERDKTSGSSSGRICTLGPIIHNPQVLEHFASLGVECLENANMARNGDYVIIRAHGVPKNEEASLRAICSVEDATCPKVKSAQLAIAKATANGAVLLLFGEASHPEVRGLVSYACGDSHVFGDMDELGTISLRPGQSYVLASQTTQDREIFERISAKLASELPGMVVLSTICDATRQRQNEALNLAREVDVMIVVGGRDSGNTRRLANLARQAGIDTWHIESAAELNRDNFEKKSLAGLTAGASTPKDLIDEVEKWLQALEQ